MWTWINFFEILFALPLVFAIIPIQGVSLSETPDNIKDGYKCLLMGINSLPNDECHNGKFPKFLCKEFF